VGRLWKDKKREGVRRRARVHAEKVSLSISNLEGRFEIESSLKIDPSRAVTPGPHQTPFGGIGKIRDEGGGYKCTTRGLET